jgi:hypothetical protein
MTPEEKADIARLIAGLVCDTEKNAAKAAWNEALERAAAIAFNGVEEEGYSGSIDRRPKVLRDAIRALKHPEDRP